VMATTLCTVTRWVLLRAFLLFKSLFQIRCTDE
jgi:hypothetical protein